MDERQELAMLRRLAELEAKAGNGRAERIKAQQEADRKLYDPTAGNSFGQNLLEGTGAGLASAGRALYGLAAPILDAVAPREKNLSDLVAGRDNSRVAELARDRAEAEQLNKPLMNTAGGTIGNVVGQAAPAALAIPFTPATAVGAITAGGLTGAALTEGGVGDRVVGGAMGAGGSALGAAVVPAYRIGRGLVRGLTEPFTEAGRANIAGRTIQRFATDPQALANIQAGPSITGALPTLAEATRDRGIATLQRAIGTMDPEADALLAARAQANNAARLETLRSIAGQNTQPASRINRLARIAQQPTQEAAEAARGAAANRSYQEAFQAGIDQPMADALAPQIQALMSRPSVQAGMARARAMAAEEGIELGDTGSVQGMHYLKRALDDQANRLRQAGQLDRSRLVSQTAADLSSTLEDIAPLYQTARREFQYNSVPVNRAMVGERLLNTTQGAIRDFGGDRRLQANAFSKALNDEANLLRQATGYRGAGGPQTLEDIMTPAQMQRIMGIRDELETAANVASAANGAGSQTAKMLASQNLLRQIAGPTGLPQSWAESGIVQELLRAPQFLVRGQEPRIGAAIADGLLNPQQAARLIQQAQAADIRLPPNALQLLLRRSAPAAIGATAANGASQ